MARETTLKRNKIAGYVVLALVAIGLIYIVVSLLGESLPDTRYKNIEKLRGDNSPVGTELLSILG